MSAFILPVSVLLYLILPVWLLGRVWFVRAGLAMIAAALLPWLVWLTEIEGLLGPGAGIALMMTAAMLLVALFPIVVGTARVMRRAAREKQKCAE